MDRRNFLSLLAGGMIVTGLGVHLSKKQDEQMPTLFLGHGSPMNAILDNSFSRTLMALGQRLPRPKAILVISAHWLTRGTWITRMERPQTIHDFHGFPQELFDVQYPAPGDIELAEAIQTTIAKPSIIADDHEWGLDHGTWSVLKHLYPKADVPVLQLSMDMTQGPEFHYRLGQQLEQFRRQGVLIVGSGNIVHNLRRLNWEDTAKPYEWALEFDQWAKGKLEQRDANALIHQFHSTEAGKLSIPTPDHYFPLLYVLGAASSTDELRFEYEEIQNSSISMRCLSFG